MASFSLVTNVAAINAEDQLQNTQLSLNGALTQLSSGLRINSSGDDPAGLTVANGYRNTVAVLNQGVLNANDGLSTLQIKDGALNNISQLLDSLTTLATQSASAGFSGSRTTLNSEFTDILGEITREVGVAGLGTSAGFSVYVNSTSGDGTVGGTIGAADTTTLGINSSNIASASSAATAVTALASAVTILGTTQESVGSIENRLQYAISLSQSQITGNQAADSRIRDANIAQESSALAQYTILQESGIAALAQANNTPSTLLKLLQ